MDSVFTELEAAVPKYRINFIGLYDDCFSLNMGRLKDFCARIRGLQEKTPWKLHWAVQLTVKKLSPEILRLLKDSGCISISFGFESFSQPVLKSMRKPIATQEIETALKLTLQHGLIVQANFIFGDVAETPATYAETLDFWKRSCQGQVNLDIIRLYPGSAIYEQSVRRGIIKDRLAFLERGVSSPVPVNFTAGMSDQQYLQMLRDVFEARRRHGVFVLPRPAKNAKGNYRVSLKCPFCGAKFKVDNIATTTKLWGTSFASFHCACWKCSRRFIAMSLLGFVWMKSKSLRYRLAKFLGPAIAQRLPPLSKGLELPP